MIKVINPPPPLTDAELHELFLDAQDRYGEVLRRDIVFRAVMELVQLRLEDRVRRQESKTHRAPNP